MEVMDVMGKEIGDCGCVSGGLFLEDIHISYIYRHMGCIQLQHEWICLVGDFLLSTLVNHHYSSAIWVRIFVGTFSVRTVSKQI